MAGFVQNLLRDAAKIVKNEAGNAVKGFFTSEYLRDYTHASKTFRTDSYAYAPKYKFLFHVYFDINKDFISAFSQLPVDQNFGLAVKNISLPKYNFELTTMNQYNRKRIVQTKIKYDPIQITFHDDNANLIRKLWYTYYTYYYKDATNTDFSLNNGVSRTDGMNSAMGLDTRDTYDYNFGSTTWGYIGESSKQPETTFAAALGRSKPSFFKAINIYGFNQHNFVLYRLVNPTIESFSHDTYDYSQTNGIMEHQMNLQYEFVKYYDGAIDGKDPSRYVPGFGTEDHYDRTLSPIARPGSNSTILGQGGLVDGAGGIINDLQNGNFVGAIQKAGASYNTFKNPQTILNAGRQELLGAISGSVTNQPNRTNTFGFPTLNSSDIKSTTSGVNQSINKFLSKPPSVPSSSGPAPIQDR
jgi:hypothetical protein